MSRVKTAFARGFRTFIRMVAAPVAAATTINWVSEEAAKLGGSKLSLGVLAALVGGAAAFLLGLRPDAPKSPPAKSLAELLEGLAAGFGTFAAADWAGVVEFGNHIPGIVIAAVSAAILCYVQNLAEKVDPTGNSPQ